MPTYSGQLVPSAVYDNVALWARSGEIGEFAALDWAAAIDGGAASIGLAGLNVGTQPTDALPQIAGGCPWQAFGADWYSRVHILPRVLDIGNLLSVQTRDVEVWNAWLTPQALAAIGESGTEGLTESGISAPTTFGALESRVFTVTVNPAGPPTIAALYTFNFPLEAPTLEVTGRRVVVFGHAPDWTKPVVEKYESLTDVIEAYDGTEQRIALRGAPRRGLAYNFNVFSEYERVRLENMLFGWQARLFALPVWTEIQTLSATLAAGSASVSCQTSGYEFAAADLVVLWAAHDQYEAVEIDTVGASSLTFATPTIADWPAGTWLMPIRLGRVKPKLASRREMAYYMSHQVDFAFEDHPGWPKTDLGDSYLGYRVHPLNPRFVPDVSREFQRKLAIFDNKTGFPGVTDQANKLTLLGKWRWLLRDRAEVVEFRSWLAARNGRAMPFWAETEGDDMELAAPIGATDTSFQIRNIGYQRYLNGRADRRHVAIRTHAGAAYYRQITGATEDSGTLETLGIDTALGALINPADIASIRFLHLSRLESDSMEIVWHTPAMAESDAAIRGLPQ